MGNFVRVMCVLCLSILFSGCTDEASVGNEMVRVVRVIDGDTIDVSLNGVETRVRYIGVNTPEVHKDERCADDATRANATLVQGQIVRLVRDTSDTDQYDRLLRYVYVGDTFVNSALVEQGWAEAVLYEPDDRFYSQFRQLEGQARDANRGCHPTGIFNDGSDRR